MRTVIIALAVGSICLTACAANPYTKFYRGKPNGQALTNYVPPTEPLQIYGSRDFHGDIQTLERRGYLPIGYSAFNANAAKVSDNQLREEAKVLGAAVVLTSSHYTNTVSGTFGASTATARGAAAFVIPYNIQKNDFSAVYLVKTRPHFGAMYGTIDAATRTRLQTNAGVLVAVVVDGSPAAKADVFPGDIVLTADGQRVDGPEQFNDYLKGRLGQPVALGIDRSGTRLEKTVALLP
jgi:membrane-associated protease RseP (regulator of RpoE activity)